MQETTSNKPYPIINKSKEAPIRINKWISNAGICSRREADKLISNGKISINGKVLTTLGYQVKHDDVVSFRNKTLKPNKNVYILLNKPKNSITTLHDPQGRQTVMDCVKDACPERLYPVGRLDRNTTGLLLLTNDGDLAQKLAHPSYLVKKIYQVELAQPITTQHLTLIKTGIKLEDGVAKVDQVEVLPGDGSTLGIEIHSGKNRIIRRLFEHLNYQIIKLDRVCYANLTKKDLPRGQWRFLTLQEIAHFKRFFGKPSCHIADEIPNKTDLNTTPSIKKQPKSTPRNLRNNP